VLVGKGADVEPAESTHIDTAGNRGLADETPESAAASSKPAVSSGDVKGK
jgi:hypothetical protein